jgi:hypothetical protein
VDVKKQKDELSAAQTTEIVNALIKLLPKGQPIDWYILVMMRVMMAHAKGMDMSEVARLEEMEKIMAMIIDAELGGRH